MARSERRIFTAGRFWLADRKDGRSPFYQICWYDETTQTSRRKSSGCARLDEAKRAILAHAEADLAAGPQKAEDALVVALLLQYWKDHGHSRRNAPTVEGSLRTFTAFLDQDKAGIDATVAELKPDVFRRFRNWRMAPHGWDILWRGERFEHRSEGVRGESVQRNLDDVRAALNHAVSLGRIPYAPKVHSVPTEMRSLPRDTRMTIKELGALVGYAAYDIEALRWILGMIATGARPEAVLWWDLRRQWQDRGPNLDTHPADEPRTKKRNAVVPVIPEFRPWAEAWADRPHPRVKSRRTWWRTMRSALGFPPSFIPKTIRHTISTELRSRGVPMEQIEGLLGHSVGSRTTQVYAKYDPDRLPKAKQELSAIWNDVCAAAKEWLANHIRTTPAYGAPIAVVRKDEKC